MKKETKKVLECREKLFDVLKEYSDIPVFILRNVNYEGEIEMIEGNDRPMVIHAENNFTPTYTGTIRPKKIGMERALTFNSLK